MGLRRILGRRMGLALTRHGPQALLPKGGPGRLGFRGFGVWGLGLRGLGFRV